MYSSLRIILGKGRVAGAVLVAVRGRKSALLDVSGRVLARRKVGSARSVDAVSSITAENGAQLRSEESPSESATTYVVGRADSSRKPVPALEPTVLSRFLRPSMAASSTRSPADETVGGPTTSPVAR